MARLPRIEYKGAWYHVMNRGAGKKNIYCTRDDYKMFLDLLDEITNRFQVQIHAYCLMSNHYHLLINTPLANLSKAMWHLNGVYARRYNRLRKTDGPLFRGRFKSILVEENKYFLTLSRYIHLNPVVAQIVRKPERYEWSSYNSYLNQNKAVSWVITEHTLSKFGAKQQQRRYRAFIEEGILGCKKRSDTFFKKIKCIPVLGSEAFAKTISEKYLVNIDFDGNKAKSLKKSLMPIRSIDFIIKVVAEYYKVGINDIKAINYGRCGNLPRAIAIYSSVQLSGQECRRIGNKFSNISCQAVSKVHREIKAKIAKDHGLLEEVDVIENRILLK